MSLKAIVAPSQSNDTQTEVKSVNETLSPCEHTLPFYFDREVKTF